MKSLFLLSLTTHGSLYWLIRRGRDEVGSFRLRIFKWTGQHRNPFRHASAKSRLLFRVVPPHFFDSALYPHQNASLVPVSILNFDKKSKFPPNFSCPTFNMEIEETKSVVALKKPQSGRNLDFDFLEFSFSFFCYVVLVNKRR